MENKSSTNNMNKEEEKSRISHGQVDWDTLRKRLEVSFLMPLSMPLRDCLLNVVTGKKSDHFIVNVDGSIQLGEDQMKR